jgi:hypothetical protein
MSGFENNRTYAEILAIVAGNGGRIDVRTFARLRWPHSLLLSRPARKAGPGGHRELGAPLHSAAAGLLGRVAWQGYLRRVDRGVYEMAERGREFLARYGSQGAQEPQGATAATTPTPAISPAIAPGRWAWAVAWDGRWYRATVVRVEGVYVLVSFTNGLQQWVNARLVVAA